MNYGLNSIYYDFNPGSISPTTNESGINYRQLEKKYAFEPSVYLEAEHKITDKLELMYGLRYSQFYRLGASTVNLYQNNEAVTFNNDLKIYEKGIPIGTKYYNNNKVIDTNSLMTAFDDYVQQATKGEDGVPINFYLREITKSAIAKAWMKKFDPLQSWQFSSGDDAETGVDKTS